MRRQTSRAPSITIADSRKFAAETRRVFSGLSTKRPEDVKVRRYLVLVLGKLQDRAALPDFLAAACDGITHHTVNPDC